MNKTEFSQALRRALGKLPSYEVEQSIAFYEEMIADRMEDGMREEEAVAALGPVEAIAAQIIAETPPIPKAIAKANTGSRTLNVVLLVVFSPLWVPVVLVLALAVFMVYLSIWMVIVALWTTVAVLILCAPIGFFLLAWCLANGYPLTGLFQLGAGLAGLGPGAVRLVRRAGRQQGPRQPDRHVRPVGEEPLREAGTVPTSRRRPAMSRSRKVVLVLATVLLVGGSALSLFAFAKAGFSLQNLSTTRDWVSSTRTLPSEAEAPHTALVVHDGCQSIRLEPTDDDAFQVEYWTNERRSVSLTDQDGVLTIEGTDEQRDGFVRFEFMSFQRGMTVVKVPRSFTGSILVETGVGDVEAAGFAGLSSVSLASSSGSVHATRIEAQDVSLSSNVGGIHAADVQAARVNASLESGSITMADVTATETLTSRTSIGDQDLRQVSAPILDVRTSSGAVHAADVAGDNLVLRNVRGRHRGHGRRRRKRLPGGSRLVGGRRERAARVGRRGQTRAGARFHWRRLDRLRGGRRV